jgi:hypothetical protein
MQRQNAEQIQALVAKDQVHSYSRCISPTLSSLVSSLLPCPLSISIPSFLPSIHSFPILSFISYRLNCFDLTSCRVSFFWSPHTYQFPCSPYHSLFLLISPHSSLFFEMNERTSGYKRNGNRKGRHSRRVQRGVTREEKHRKRSCCTQVNNILT